MGVAFSLLAALCFALYQIFFRRAVVRTGESASAVFLSVPLGALFFLFLLAASGQLSSLTSFSLQGLLLLVGAGLFNFIIGRGLNFHCIRLIGNNRAAPLINTAPIHTAFFAILLLKEPFTFPLLLGILLIVTGATIVSQTGDGSSGAMAVGASFREGVAAGLTAAFLFGITSVMVRHVLQGFHSPLAATFVSYGAAAMVVAWMPFSRGLRARLARLDRSSLGLLLLSGLLVATAQAFRYGALGLAPASVVEPLVATYSLFLFTLSWLINRRLEVFSLKVATGIVATVLGVVLVAR